MKTAKRIVGSLAAAALATSMVCAAPIAAQAAPTASEANAVATAGSTYSAMATAKVSKQIKLNQPQQLTFKLNYKKIKSTKVKWKSSSVKIAKVSKEGIVTPKKEGKVTVTGKYQGHTIYYNLTIKGDAAFDAASKAMQKLIKEGANNKISGADNVKYYEFKTTEDNIVYTMRYNVTNKTFDFIWDENDSAVMLTFSTKFANKDCTLVAWSNAVDGNAPVNTITLKKNKYKLTNTYGFSSDDVLNEQLNTILSKLTLATSEALQHYDGYDLTYLGFTGFKVK